MTISAYIVEDYLLTRVGLEHTLNKFSELNLLGGYETAEECIEAMRENPSDIVLMDLGLPRMNGIEATKVLKEKYPKTKVIILTSHEKDETVLAALSAGANAYCLKDLEEENLLKIIKTVQDGALWLAPQVAKIPGSHLQKSTNFGNTGSESESDATLTTRELAILKLIVEGKTNPEIAKEIMISTHTVKAHVSSLLSKLNVEDRVQAAVKAIKSNLI